ncbi:hypothetical protein G9A89_001839 [Geosiphon pyriformis]|nr:hypothetical protein G9A89_001839 [Geosiphon pyriformis]
MINYTFEEPSDKEVFYLTILLLGKDRDKKMTLVENADTTKGNHQVKVLFPGSITSGNHFLRFNEV